MASARLRLRKATKNHRKRTNGKGQERRRQMRPCPSKKQGKFETHQEIDAPHCVKTHENAKKTDQRRGERRCQMRLCAIQKPMASRKTREKTTKDTPKTKLRNRVRILLWGFGTSGLRRLSPHNDPQIHSKFTLSK